MGINALAVSMDAQWDVWVDCEAPPTAPPPVEPLEFTVLSDAGCCRSDCQGKICALPPATVAEFVGLDEYAACPDRCRATAGCTGYELYKGDTCEVHTGHITQTAENELCSCHVVVQDGGGVQAAPTAEPQLTTGGTSAPSPGIFRAAAGTAHLRGRSEEVASVIETLTEAQGVEMGGKLYIFGGFRNGGWRTMGKAAYAFDPERTAKVTRPLGAVQGLPGWSGFTHAGNAADYGTGTIYLVGGLGLRPGDFWPHDAEALSTVLSYHPASATWGRLPDLPQPRGALAAAVTPSGILHAFGGASFGGGRFTADRATHWAIDLRSPGASWRELAPLNVARNHLGAGVYDGVIYAIGGQSLELEGCSNFNTVDAFDPAVGLWSRVASLPVGTGHIGPAVVTHEFGLIVVGGVHDRQSSCSPPGKPSGTWKLYDPLSDSWRQQPASHSGASQVSGLIGGAIFTQAKDKIFRQELVLLPSE